MTIFLKRIAAEPDIARVPVMIDSSKWSVIEAGPQVRLGQADRQFDQHEGRRRPVPRARPQVPRLWRRGRRHGVRRGRPGRHRGAQGRHLRARLQAADRRRVRAAGHHLRPEHLRHRDRHRRAPPLRASTSSRRPARSAAAVPASTSRAACRTSASRSAATSPSAARCTACSSTTPFRRAWTWASSTPASSTSTTRSIPELREAVEDVILDRNDEATETADRARRALQGHRRRRGEEARRMAVAAGDRASVLRAGEGHRRPHRRRHRGSAPGCAAPDRGHRGPADGRHERRRRPVRLGQDVPAAGGEVRAGDEEGGRAPHPLHRGGEGKERRHRRARAAS